MKVLEKENEIAINNGEILPLMEEFYTIQGEGFHTGRAAYFIRLAGCDVGCTWCDVKESWNAENHSLISVEQLVKNVKSSGADFCVITGGEPATYNLQLLTKVLVENNIQTAIETSGVYPVTGIWHWVCFSPKKFKTPDENIYQMANELKIIVFNKHDLEWARSQAEKVKSTCRLYLQPEWEKKEEMLPLIIDFVKLNPQWKISLQTHKYINVP